eukprot:m.524822 g.524822  ORF g.524822 m.524822 type:complete len:202 (-) comp57533_c1_seq8:2199-2804(-)
MWYSIIMLMFIYLERLESLQALPSCPPSSVVSLRSMGKELHKDAFLQDDRSCNRMPIPADKRLNATTPVATIQLLKTTTQKCSNSDRRHRRRPPVEPAENAHAAGNEHCPDEERVQKHRHNQVEGNLVQHRLASEQQTQEGNRHDGAGRCDDSSSLDKPKDDASLFRNASQSKLADAAEEENVIIKSQADKNAEIKQWRNP